MQRKLSIFKVHKSHGENCSLRSSSTNVHTARSEAASRRLQIESTRFSLDFGVWTSESGVQTLKLGSDR